MPVPMQKNEFPESLTVFGKCPKFLSKTFLWNKSFFLMDDVMSLVFIKFIKSKLKLRKDNNK